jgi:hypothetical protein
MDQSASNRRAASAKARFIRKKILQHKRRFRNKMYQQLKIQASTNTSTPQTATLSHSQPIAATTHPISNAGAILNSHKSPASITAKSQIFTTPPTVHHPRFDSHASTITSNVFHVLTVKGNTSGPRNQTSKVKPFHGCSPICTPLYSSQYHMDHSNKENNQSAGPSSRRQSISAAKNTPLTNITSNYVNRKNKTTSSQHLRTSQPKPMHGAHHKSRQPSNSFKVNLSSKFDAATTTSNVIQVHQPNQIPTLTEASGSTHKRANPTAEQSHDAIPDYDDSDSSEECNEYGDESGSESDCDDPTGSLPNGLPAAPQGSSCGVLDILLLNHSTFVSLILIIIYKY